MHDCASWRQNSNTSWQVRVSGFAFRKGDRADLVDVSRRMENHTRKTWEMKWRPDFCAAPGISDWLLVGDGNDHIIGGFLMG